MKQFFFERPTNKLERKTKGKLPKQPNSSRPPYFFTLNTLCVARPEQKAKLEVCFSSENIEKIQSFQRKSHLQEAHWIFSIFSFEKHTSRNQFQSFHRKSHLQGALSIQKSRRGPERGTTVKFETNVPQRTLSFRILKKFALLMEFEFPTPPAPCLSLAPTSKPTLYPAPALT